MWGLGLVLAAVVALGVWLWLSPPELLRVADGYSAKMVCSNVFVAGRDADEVLSVDVQAPGNPVLKLVRLSVDTTGNSVTASMLGLFAPMTAIYRPGLGCALVPDGNLEAARQIQLAHPDDVDPTGAWPLGESVDPPDPAVQAVLGDPALTGPGMRAVVVIRDGKLVGEVYGDGFDEQTPLLGWSMTKTVNAVLVGMAMADGKLTDGDAEIFPGWRNDPRKDITPGDLLSMTSGLAFNEDYGDVTDVTRMLFLEPDMTAFAASQPLVAPPRTKFNYSSGTAVLLAKLWMQRVGGGPTALRYPYERLFKPLGMTSAVLEADASGTFVGSSYLYATARDWARFGQFLLQNGMWNGQQLVPAGFIGKMQTSNGLPGAYSQAQSWMDGPKGAYWSEIGLPFAFWLEGHDGQSIAVIPSKNMVVVRLGLTPWSKYGYGPEDMIKAILAAVGG